MTLADILTLQQASDYIGIYHGTLRGWVHSGRIRPIEQAKVPGYVFTYEECDRAKSRGIGNTRRMIG